MTGFPRSPRLTRAGLVLIDPDGGAVERIISLQYASENLQRSFQIQVHQDVVIDSALKSPFPDPIVHCR